MSRALAVASALALLATGCGGDDGDDEPAAAEEAPAPADEAGEAIAETEADAGASAAPECALTVEDVSQALGEEMVEAESPPCSFERKELPDTGPFVQYRPSPAQVIKAFGQGGSPPVDGVGDEAYFEPGSGNLAVLSGEAGFQIQLLEFEADTQATAVGLAEVVLAQL